MWISWLPESTAKYSYVARTGDPLTFCNRFLLVTPWTLFILIYAFPLIKYSPSTAIEAEKVQASIIATI